MTNIEFERVDRDAGELSPWWLVELRFNGAKSGMRQVIVGKVKAEDPFEAAKQASFEACKRDQGYPICVTGFTVDEIKK